MRSFYLAATLNTHLLRLLLAPLPLNLPLPLLCRQLLLRRLQRLAALDALPLLLPLPLALRRLLLLPLLLDQPPHRLLTLLQRLLRRRCRRRHQVALVAVAHHAGRVFRLATRWLVALRKTRDVRHQVPDVA